ncbi:hypothetical protein B0H11DRAFT_2313851 [Mycena galericulata]|nr:hypothetical protein B0H11DRAFT_2313851 [Mycena galericulata]
MLHVHPQGWIYFSNPSLRVVTDQVSSPAEVKDVRLPEIYEVLHDQATRLNPLNSSDKGIEMHLQVAKELSGPSGGRGFLSLAINHTHCIASHDLGEVKEWETLQRDPRIWNRRRRLYYNYLWTHPCHAPLPSSAHPEANDALLWYITDNLISAHQSVVPFSKLECEDLSRVLKDLTDPCYDSSPAKTVFISWFLREVCSFRDSVQYGTRTLKESDALRKSKASSSTIHRPAPVLLPLLNLVIRVFFFGIPLIYLSHVQQNWQNYIERLVRDYADFLLIVRHFLSHDDILPPSKTAAIISALASLGSIIVGVVAIWRHQASTRTADSVGF